MSFLLDTHVFLWYISGHSSLSPRAKGIIEAKTGLKFSIASLWEISIKVNIGKLKLTGSFSMDFLYETGIFNGCISNL